MEETPSIKNVLEQYLQALYDNLNNINKFEKNRTKDIVQSNNMLSSQLHVSYPESSKTLIPITSVFTVTQKIINASMQACDQNLRTKLEQIRNYTVTMEQRIKDEAKRFREAFNGVLYLNDVSIMSYYDVEASTEEHQHKIEQLAQQTEEGKQNTMKVIKDIQNMYADITQDVGNLEVVTNELSLILSNWQSSVNEKLHSLSIAAVTDINTMSSEEESLRKDISELLTKLENHHE